MSLFRGNKIVLPEKKERELLRCLNKGQCFLTKATDSLYMVIETYSRGCNFSSVRAVRLEDGATFDFDKEDYEVIPVDIEVHVFRK